MRAITKMIKKYINQLIIIALLGFSFNAFSQSTKFQRIIGGTGDDRSYSMNQTKDGGYILTGYTKSFGAGGEDIYLTKTDGLGKVVWSKTYGTSNNETGWKVKQTSDSGYVVVGTSSSKKGDGIFFKTDMNGSIKWGYIFNSDSAEEVYNVIESRINGAFYLTGFLKTDSFGTDAFISKYSASGNLVWQRLIGGVKDEEGYAVVEELNGNIGIVGKVIDDDVTMGGTNGVLGDEDIFISRFTPDGKNIWTKNYGTVGNDQAWDIKYSKGEYVISGWTNAGSIGGDILVAIVDTSGSFTKAFTISGSGSSRAFSIIINPDDSYSLTGYMNTVASDREAFYLNTTRGGFVGAFNLLGGTATDGHWPSEITKTIDGGYTVFTSSNSFKSGSSYELYMVRLDNNGSGDCNQSNTAGANKTLTMQSDTFGFTRAGFVSNTLSLTTKSVTTLKDSVLCCKLQAQVVGKTVRICKGESVRIGKPSIPGYVYKWNAIGGSYTSSEASPLVSPNANTTYKLVVSSSDGKCKKDSATVVLSIRADLANKNFVRDTFFCLGDSVKIKARSGAINYAWLGKKTNLSGQNVILFQEDVIILTVTDTTTCKYNDTFKVVKKSLPVFDLGNDTTICDNTKITLSGPAKMKSYNWNSGQASTRTFQTSEEKIHSLAVVDSFGCKFNDTKIIYNNPSSTFSLGPDTSICKGINYTIIGPGALTNFYWNGVSTFNANKIVNNAGTYICQAQNTFGCKHTDTIVIKLKSDPTFSLGADGGVCKSGGRNLVGPADMIKYQWDDGSSNSSYDVYKAGTFWLKVTGKNGCVFADTIKLVLVDNPTPELGNDTTIYDCDTIYLDAGNYTSYKWNTGQTTRKLMVTKANLYEVTVTDINTCRGIDDKSVKTKVCNKSVNSIKIPGLIIKPNPATNKLKIEWLANQKEASIVIYDIHGKIVLNQKAIPGLGLYNFEVSDWSRGLYYVKVTTSASSQTIKIILE